MRAVVIDRFGGPEVLQVKNIDRPEPGPGELLVRVICSGTNPVDAKLCQNASWANLTPPIVLGSDASGIVERVGPGVTDFDPGDEVYYTPEIVGRPLGTYAEFNAVPASIVAPKPPSLSHEEAAAVPLAGGTAWDGIVRRLQVQPGETVLIHGGAGGVGSFAVQFARAAGAFVIATASTANQGVLQRLGADVSLDYTQHEVADAVLEHTDGRGADAVFDTAGGENISKSIRATAPFGRLCTILTPTASMGGLTSRNQTLHGLFLTREARRLREMSRVIEQGKVKPLVHEVLLMEEVRRAHERLHSGHGTGKIVLRVAPAT
ncbi:MAG: zinc-dependent alcohol dehydrogenase family protein [Bacteroidota bacterium]